MHDLIIALERAEFPPSETAVWEPRSLPDASGDRDPLVENLVQALLRREKAQEVSRGIETDMLLSVLMNRLTELRNKIIAAKKQPRVISLQKWRLERAYRFVDANIDKPIRLEGLAKASGLSRMHFAAQFRAATGLRPHDYVLRRRVQCARSMLVASDRSIVEVALSVGFRTQAHFTTVFKRIVGLTPYRWREFQSQEPSQSSRGETVRRAPPAPSWSGH
jgi:AraC family transcriptional regulator